MTHPKDMLLLTKVDDKGMNVLKVELRGYLCNLCSCEKKAWENSCLPGFESWPLRYRCSVLSISRPVGNWSANWFVIFPGKVKMKWWIYEIHVHAFELWNKGMLTNIISDVWPTQGHAFADKGIPREPPNARGVMVTKLELTLSPYIALC